MFDRGKRAITRTPTAGRTYQLAGLVRCEICGRRMQGHWSHGRAYYRCKFRDDYPGGDLDHPKNIYVHERAVLPGLDAWLASLFDDDHIDHTCATLAGAVRTRPRHRPPRGRPPSRHRRLRPQARQPPHPARHRRRRHRRRHLDHRHPTRPQEPRTPNAKLGQPVPGGDLTTSQVTAIVNELRDIIEVLASADPTDKSELYNQLGISLRYNPAGTICVQAHPREAQVRVGGGYHPAETPTVRWALHVG